jgi:hypothetical protein
MLVVCNGMVRGGSTLQYNLVRGIAVATGAGTGYGSFEHEEDSTEDLAHSVQSGVIRVAKTHGIPPSMPGHLQNHLEGFRVCYIYRDLRDVAVSMRAKFRWTDERLAQELDLSVQRYEVLRQYRDQPNVLWQRYEDTVVDLVAAVRECAEFIEVDVDDETVDQVAEDASVAKAKAVMKTVRDHVELQLLDLSPHALRKQRRQMRSRKFLAYDRATQLHWNHISPNEGRSGTWREHLSEEQVARIETRYAAWFDDAGYQVD